MIKCSSDGDYIYIDDPKEQSSTVKRMAFRMASRDARDSVRPIAFAIDFGNAAM